MSDHPHRPPDDRPVRARVVTVSDRCHSGEREDRSGPAARDELERAGVTVVEVRVVPDDPAAVRSVVQEKDVDVVFCTGGTGVGPRDITIETVEPLLDKTLPGFGELFRARSVEQVGTAAFLSRATAGVVAGRAVFCVPGSPKAAALGARLAASEMAHLVYHVLKG